MSKLSHLIVTGLLLAFAPAPVFAQAPHPAVPAIEALDTGLLTGTRAGSVQDQARTLAPLLQSTFQVEAMAQFIVGPAWTQLAKADRDSITAALNDYLAARFADEFDGNKQRITIDPAVKVRGPDAVVRTRVAETGQPGATVDYRMRTFGGAWRVIDVYYDGVGMLATQRTDAQAAFAKGGAAGLVRHMRTAAAAFH